MKVSARKMKWAMRFYPPLFFQRIWVTEINEDFSYLSVKINRSILNINYNKSIFGGTIFSSVDPFYAVMFHQILLRKGIKTITWLKGATVNYIKPGHGNLYFHIHIPQEEINHAVNILNTEGKYVKSYPIEIRNEHGELCATLTNEVYLRDVATIKKVSK